MHEVPAHAIDVRGADQLSPAILELGVYLLVRALSGGGDPVTFDGEFYHVSGLDPAAAPAPRVFTGSVGPKSLAVTGQLADGWIPPGGSD